MSNTNTTMNAAWNAKGQTVTIKPDSAYTPSDVRKVVSVRSVYGEGIMWTLDKPLTGNTSPLFEVTPATAYRVAFI